MGMEVEEGDLLRKMEKKSKKNKRNRANALEELSDCRDAMHKRVKDSVKLSKEEKKKKNKEKHEPCDDIEFNLKQNEAKNVEDYVEVDISNNEEKDQKKKKKRKLEVDKNEKECVNVKKKHKRTGNDGEAIEIKEASHRKIHAGGEENRGLRMNDSEDLGSDFELEARKAKKRKHKKNRNKDGIDAVSSSMEILEDNKMGKDKITMGRNKFEKENIAEMKNVEEGNKKKKKKKGTRDKEGSDVKGKKSIANGKDVDQSTVLSENRKSKRTSKRVSFSGHVEVFPLSDGPNHGEDQVKGLVRGKRFSREEDEMVKEAVSNYIEEHGLGEEGLDMVLHCISHSELRNCWREIGAALPWRPVQSIYYRAHILFERDENRAWTSEEYEIVRRFHEKHGSDWKMLADAMGKHRFHVKDTWRRIKLPNLKKGHWSQEEYQTLFDLVNMDLRMKASEEKKSKHGMLRDNICWEAISDKLSTRINASCCQKWYNQLTSSMVAGGEWADADDYRLIDVLFSLDACCMEDVDWDCLLEHRSGDVCRKRWNQMVKHIGERGNKSFAEQVEILSKRYCLDVLEAREAYDSKPAVP